MPLVAALNSSKPFCAVWGPLGALLAALGALGRYGAVTFVARFPFHAETSFFGGSYGAGVPPPPFSENKETEIQHRLAPKPIKRPPGKDLTKSKLG